MRAAHRRHLRQVLDAVGAFSGIQQKLTDRMSRGLTVLMYHRVLPPSLKAGYPLPGLVIEVKVAIGDKVAVGDVLLVIETMKMENNIISTVAGTVKEILVSKGDNVGEGIPLIAIEG